MQLRSKRVVLPPAEAALTTRRHELLNAAAAERETLVIWRRPFSTLYYFFLALHAYALTVFWQLYNHRIITIAALSAIAGAYYYGATYYPEALNVAFAWGYLAYFWVGLGVLSTVGLGTGLHTFVLYLGPFIAQCSIAGYAHGTTQFAAPFNPAVSSTWSQLLPAEGAVSNSSIDMWDIVRFVRWPTLLFGAGTAIGELPPYFIGRAATLTGMADEVEDADFQDFQETMNDTTKQDLASRGKRFMHALVTKAGFFGILAAASIPNPLFDMAGITCGTCLVPFWTFFGATLIGKAIIKCHYQMILTVFLMGPKNLAMALDYVARVPVLGPWLKHELEAHVERTKGLKVGDDGAEGTDASAFSTKGLLKLILVVLVVAMIAAFVGSIVSQFAQGHKRKLDKAKIEEQLEKEA